MKYCMVVDWKIKETRDDTSSKLPIEFGFLFGGIIFLVVGIGISYEISVGFGIFLIIIGVLLFLLIPIIIWLNQGRFGKQIKDN